MNNLKEENEFLEILCNDLGERHQWLKQFQKQRK